MLPVVNMDEDFFLEYLFVNGDGIRSVEEMREEIEWKICEYYDAYEPESQPVICPFSLYMVDFMDRVRKIGLLSPTETRVRLNMAWAARADRIKKFVASTSKDMKGK